MQRKTEKNVKSNEGEGLDMPLGQSLESTRSTCFVLFTIGEAS